MFLNYIQCSSLSKQFNSFTENCKYKFILLFNDLISCSELPLSVSHVSFKHQSKIKDHGHYACLVCHSRNLTD